MISILLTYLLVAVAVMMYAGVGGTGLGLGNEENSDNVFGALAEPVLGNWGGLLLFLAVFMSSIASLQTTFLPVARAMLAMVPTARSRRGSPRSTRAIWSPCSPR